jgi:hypothetical protein
MKRVSRRTVIAIVPVAAVTSVAQPARTAILEAAVERIIPSDESGPGARECGAANYIASVMDAAFSEGLDAIDREARAKFGRGFAECAPENQDAILEATARPFFNRLRQLTIEGTFSDPAYGGNRNFAGWDLIRYPGPRLAVGPDDQKMREAIKPVRRSTGHGH